VECPFAGLPIAITINITVAITIIVAAGGLRFVIAIIADCKRCRRRSWTGVG